MAFKEENAEKNLYEIFIKQIVLKHDTKKYDL